MRNWLLIVAALLIVGGVFYYTIGFGLIILGVAVGALAWFSE